MKLKDFIATVDYDYNVYTGAPSIGYSCVGTDSFKQEWMDYEVKSIVILSQASYQVNLIPPKKPWVEPSYTIGILVGVNDLSKDCCFCANKHIDGKCSDCNTLNGCYLNWKNMFIKED